MTIITVAELERRIKLGLEGTGTCRATDKARIIVPTACDEAVGFTNPDDLDETLLERWKNGERGPEFENQQLKPGDCLVMYNNGRDINQLLSQYPDWHKSVQGIKAMIERLYSCAEFGGKMTEPAIWNSDLNWAKKVHLRTTGKQDVTEDMWSKNAGTAMEVVKCPPEQKFVHIAPDDVLITKEKLNDGSVVERKQTAGAMSAIAVQQPDGTWNIVQLNAKGYEVTKENHAKKEKGIAKKSKGVSDLLSKAASISKVSEKVQASLDPSLSYRERLDAIARRTQKVTKDILEKRFGPGIEK